MTHTYPGGLRSPVFADAVLVFAWLVAWFVIDVAAVRVALLAAIPIVLAWGAATLHMPARVDVDDDGVTFHRYGRAHRFAWQDVTRVRVRRFVVRDRVLVRIDPSGPWRGRYWLLDAIDGFDDLVRQLESRSG
jgi:hypothetical protein